MTYAAHLRNWVSRSGWVVENLLDLAELVELLFIVRRALCEQIGHPASPPTGHRPGRRRVPTSDDAPRCRPVVALTYRATVDVPARFRKSMAVGAVFGLTCSKYQSGEIDRSARISRCGDEMMRVSRCLFALPRSVTHKGELKKTFNERSNH